MLFENFLRASRLVVERYVGTALLHELHFLFRAGGSDHLETLCLRNLHDGTIAWSADIGAW